MATFGQGINPQLGAIDYSPILRGSLAGAEMAARGSQMIGQGIASLGEEAGKAVQKYYYNKDTKEMLGGVTKRIAGILDTDPYIANRLGLRKDPKTNTWDEKGIAIAVTTLGGGDVRKGVQMTSGFLSDRAAQQVQNSAFLGATRPGVIMPGQETAMYSALGGDNPMGFAQYMQGQELGAANIAEKRSQAQLNLATAGSKVSLTGFGTLKEAEDSIPTEQRKNYTFHFTNNRYVALPVSRETELKVGALEASATAVEAGKTPESALNAVKGTPETHRVEWTGKNFTAIPFNKTELLEQKSKQGILDEKDKKTLFERRQYGNKIDNELYAAGVMKEQLASLAGKASSVEPGFWTTLVSNVPGTEQYDFAKQVDTIMSKIGFDRLRQMREISPNGSSGLGALNVKEFDALQNSLANLKISQSYSQFLDNLDIVQKNYDRVIASLEQDKRDFSSSGGSAVIPMWNPTTQSFDN